jgi:hypothetical protein
VYEDRLRARLGSVMGGECAALAEFQHGPLEGHLRIGAKPETCIRNIRRGVVARDLEDARRHIRGGAIGKLRFAFRAQPADLKPDVFRRVDGSGIPSFAILRMKSTT